MSKMSLAVEKEAARLVQPTGSGDLRAARRLAELEVVIERGKAAFVEIGEALVEIRDSKLYRLQYGTFEDYCRGRWDFTRQRGYQLIAAAEVALSLSKTVDTPIANEAQAAQLAPVLREHGPERAAEAYATAIERSDGRPTARVVREVVAEIIEGPRDNATETERRAELMRAIEAIEALTHPRSEYAAAVFTARRATTAKRLRDLGVVLGGIAVELERIKEETE